MPTIIAFYGIVIRMYLKNKEHKEWSKSLLLKTKKTLWICG